VPERREAGLLRVRQWFAPAFEADEVLVAALAGSTDRLTLSSSLLATGKLLVGQNPARILLLTDRSIHIAARKFSRRRYKKLIMSYPRRGVAVTWDEKALRIADRHYYLNPAGYQLGGVIGTEQDVELFLGATDPA
jgi:hypothetical protein